MNREVTVYLNKDKYTIDLKLGMSGRFIDMSREEALQVSKQLSKLLRTNNENTIKLVSPLYVVKNKKGDKWYLNLNNYRNTHFQSLNNYKKKYKEVMVPQIQEIEPITSPIRITYTIYPETRRSFDIANVGSVIDKFLCDAIVELGKLEDDNYKHLPEVIYEFGSIDKLNPRCEITIETL